MKIVNIKNLLIGCLTIAAIIFGCSDALDRGPIGETEESFFDEEEDYFSLSITAYSEMTDFYWWHGGPNNYLHGLWHMSGDDITSEQQFEDMELFTAALNPNNGKISEYWSRAYTFIGKANVIIDKINDADRSAFEEPSFLDHIKGEGYFFRGYMYWKLYNKFGTSPLITERIENIQDVNNPKSEGTQLLDQAVNDLRQAIELLPPSWDDNNQGRVYKNSARGMLVKALVFRGNYTGNNADYTEALSVFNSMSGVSLADNYTDNFNAYTENDANPESLFEFQASKAPGVDNVWLDNGGPWRGVESMHAYWGFYTVAGNAADNNSGGDAWRITEKLNNAYGDDPRIDFFTEDDRRFTKYGKEGLDEIEPFGFTGGSTNNPRLLRYADVMLLAAEAAARTGAPGTAIELINEVRTRARNWAEAEPSITVTGVPADRPTGETDTNTILEWVFDERWVELAGEEDMRWFDLKRMHETGMIDLTSWDAGNTGWSTDRATPTQFSEANLIWPIPQDELDRNAAILTNNPGY